MLKIKDAYKYNQLQLTYSKGILAKLFAISISGLFSWAALSDFQAFIQKDPGLIHVAVLSFLGMAVLYLYMLGEVLRGERKIHVLANDEQIRWIVYDNEKIKQDVTIFKKDIKKINIKTVSSFGHYVASEYVFMMKDGTRRKLDDWGSFSFAGAREGVRDFFYTNGYGNC